MLIVVQRQDCWSPGSIAGKSLVPLIPALGRLRWEDEELEAVLSTASPWRDLRLCKRVNKLRTDHVCIRIIKSHCVFTSTER
jgi:hypothetical protein